MNKNAQTNQIIVLLMALFLFLLFVNINVNAQDTQSFDESQNDSINDSINESSNNSVNESINETVNQTIESENETNENLTGNSSTYLINLTPVNGSQIIYEPGMIHVFSSTWSNNTDIINVMINHNFTESSSNEVLTSIQLEDKLEYLYALELGAGIYYWNMSLETESENITTQLNSYEVLKAEPNISLLLNDEYNNLTINESDVVNITAWIHSKEGTFQLLLNNQSILETTNNTINRTLSLSNQFNYSGLYELKALYIESGNYSFKELVLYVTVLEKPLEINVETDKEKYDLGETGKYLVSAPDFTHIEVRICKNTSLGNLNWRECTPKQIIQEEIYPLLFTHSETKNAGIYEIEAKVVNKSVEVITQYEVIDSMTLSVSGETSLKINEETTLKAVASGGIAPYTYNWTLPDGSTKTGAELKIKYADAGDRNIKLVVTDVEGNKKEQTTKLEVRQYFDLNIEVRNQDNQILKDALVTVSDLDLSSLTDAAGKVKFNLPKEEYRIRVESEGFETKTQDVNLSSVISLTIKLEPRKTSVSSSSASAEITLQAPSDKSRITNKDIEFQAVVNLEENSICKLFVADKNSQWFVEYSRKENIKQESVAFQEELEIGEYKWKVSCENSKETKESEVRELSVVSATFSSLNDDETIDAGELRRQIEIAHDNFNSLDLQSRKAAEAIDLQELLRISLRDYERILRDINSLSLRRDLTELQKEDKLLEYKELIRELEKSTILELEVIDALEFVVYPDKEELVEIAKEYGVVRNIQGKLDTKDVEDLQNLIRVRTYSALVTLTYLTGDQEDITLIQKSLEYTGNITKTHFIIEKIPLALRSDITVLQTHDSLKRNELLRFENPEKIMYYVKGHSDLEETKSAHTILLNEGSFKTGSSGSGIAGFTGFASINVSDIDSTTGLVVLLIILIIAYLLYAFDIKDKVFDLVAGSGKNKKLKQLKVLINDAKDYLEVQNLERANLIYKEIKMLYEKSPRLVKNEVYEEAISLIKVLNEKYLEHLIMKTHDELKSGNRELAITTYNKLTDIFNKSEADTQKSFRDQIIKINGELKNAR